ncbi:MAG: hypothetical protein ACYCQL_00335 [Acidithiobacillus sp.]
MMTATEARELAGPNADEYLKEIEVYIREAATRKERSVIIRKNPYASWLYDERDMSPEARIAVNKLREAGYTVLLYYVELQFVDMGLEIEW